MALATQEVTQLVTQQEAIRAVTLAVTQEVILADTRVVDTQEVVTQAVAEGCSTWRNSQTLACLPPFS